MPETWDVFSARDVTLALIGFAGFISVFTVMRTALKLNVKRELSIKQQRNSDG